MPKSAEFHSRSIRPRRTNGDGEPDGGPMIIFGVVAAIVIVVMSVMLTITGFGSALRTQLLTSTPDFLQLPSDVTVDFYALPPLSGQAPLKVRFINLSQGSIGTCLWDFGDESLVYEGCGAEQGIEYQYAEPGVYTVTLRVIDLNGETFDAIRENYIVVRK